MVKTLCDYCRRRNGRPFTSKRGHDLMLCEPCISREVRHLTNAEIAHRYPRLVRALKWAAILCDSEAVSAIRDYRDGYGGPGFGCEAVAHFGGPLAAIRAALRSRHVALSLRS